MTEIVPGIFQLKVLIPDNPLGFTNSYLLRGDDGFTIIDPGMNDDKSFESLKNELSEAGVAIENITRIIATHAHGDHYGLSGRIKKLSNAEIVAHRLVGDTIKIMAKHRQDRFRQMEETLRLNGAPPLDESERRMGPAGRRRRFRRPPEPDMLLQGGERISIDSFNLDVLWTPGHDTGHICLYEAEKKVLFSGDHVLPVTTPHVNLQTQSSLNPLSDFLNSLEKVKNLDAKVVLPGHEETFTDLRARVEQLIEHHHQRNTEILEALKPEPKTAYQISTEIIWMPVQGGVRYQDLTPWHKRMAVGETLAHLRAMELEGKVEKFSQDDIIYYRHNC